MKKRYIIIVVILLCLTILVILELKIYFSPKGIKIDKEIYPITGIDISKHTGKIDWVKIKNQNINFVYIKATEGQDYIDPNYKSNLSQALKSEIKVGIYHFFRFNKSGKSQALNFLTHCKSDSFNLTPVLDIELWGNLPFYKSDLEIRKEINEFLITAESAFGCKMIIYSNRDSYNRFIKGEFLHNPIWLCTFNKNPQLPDSRKWLFWQHAHNGKLAGINGYADMNTFNGDMNAWKKYISSLK